MLKIGSIVWGVQDVLVPLRSGEEALDYKPGKEPGEDWAILVPKNGSGQQMAITIVSSEAKDHQRHHLDLYAADQDAEVKRLVSIGAQKVDWHSPDGADYVVLADPDGNTFCVIEDAPAAPKAD